MSSVCLHSKLPDSSTACLLFGQLYIYKSAVCLHCCQLFVYFSAISMVVGILCFPAGWDNEDVRGICGKEAQDYGLGLCGIRWAFVMAFICVIDAFILSLLALVLSKRQIEPLPALNSSNNIYRGKFEFSRQNFKFLLFCNFR